MTSVDRGHSQDKSVELMLVEANLRAVIAQLDAAGQRLAAAYAELALDVMVPDPGKPAQFSPADDRRRSREQY